MKKSIITLVFYLICMVFSNSSQCSSNLTWTNKTSLPTPRTGMGCVAVNGKIYAIGGYRDDPNPDIRLKNIVEEYDVAENRWTTKASMKIARFFLAAVSANNKIYAIGGSDGNHTLSTVEEYDIANDTWTTKNSMLTGHSAFAAAVVNNKIYVIGGYDHSNFLEEYDINNDTWVSHVNLPSGRSCMAACVLNNLIYIVGGGYSGESYSTMVFDPDSHTFTTKTSMPLGRYDVMATVLNNKIYVIGGTYGSGALNKVESYDPATDTWTTETSLAIERSWPSAVTVGDKMYILGGQISAIYPAQVEEGSVPSQSTLFSINTPSNGQTVRGNTLINAVVNITSIIQVELYIDNSLKITLTQAPYQWVWDTTKDAEGTHTIKAIAYTSGQSYSDEITVNVHQTAADKSVIGNLKTEQALVKPAEGKQAKIKYSLNLPQDKKSQYGEQAKIHVKITVHTVRGVLVKTLVDHDMSLGEYEQTWNGKSFEDELTASGVYIVKIQAGDYKATQKIVVIR